MTQLKPESADLSVANPHHNFAIAPCAEMPSIPIGTTPFLPKIESVWGSPSGGWRQKRFNILQTSSFCEAIGDQ
jgi:hypothetical protein